MTRIAYLGTSAFAAAVLEAIAQDALAPVLVVTRPDAPAGRGRKLASPPVAIAARALGLELRQPQDINTQAFAEDLKAAAPDVVVVCAFGALVREPLLSDHEILNVHPSLLPRWRGAAPVERAIMAGDAQTGVCIMRLTAGLDSGPVCLRAVEPIGLRDTYGTLTERLQPLGARLLAQAIREHPPFAEQDEAQVTYAEKITAADRTLDLGRPADELERTVRALAPHIGARIALPGGAFLGVHEATVEDGRLRLVTVQPPGGRPMAYADYVRGHDPVAL